MNDTITALKDLGRPAQGRWMALSVRERRLLTLAALMLLGGLLWATVLMPVLTVWQEAPQRWQAIDERSRAMQALSAEAQQLQALAKGSLRTQPQGLAAAQALREQSQRWQPGIKTSVAGDRATLEVQGASSEQLQLALAEARLLIGARAVQARLQAQTQGPAGSLVGQVVLQWGSP